MQAEALHDDLAGVPRADLHPHHPPPKGREKGILAFVPRFDQRALVHTAVNLDGNPSRNVGKVDVVPPHRVVDNELHSSSKKTISEHRLRSGDGLGGLSGSGNVLVPPVSAFAVGAHGVPLSSKPLLHRGGGAPDLRSNFGSAKSGGVEGPHLLSGDRQSSHVAKVAASSGSSKLRGHTVVSGIPIAIEKRIGDIRSGVGADGVKWKTRLSMAYGYIKGSKGADGEDIDCYVGPHKDAPNAYVVHQRKSDGTGYDEDKVILGLRNKEEATKGYLAHYNSDKFLGPVKEVPVERLKEMLSTGKKLEKISAAPPVEVLKAIHAALPRGQRILKEDVLHPMTRNRLVSHVRMELNNVLPEVPFHQRLKSYKDFKSTGALGPVRPRYNRETKGVTYRHSASGDPVVSARLLPAADDTVTLHSYGKDVSLGKALKDPATRMDHPFLMPGRTRPTTHGMYFFEEGSTPANAARYAAHGEGSPSRLEIKVPRSKVLHYDVKGGERVVSADDIKSYAHTARIDPVKLAAMCARAFRGFRG